jgi:hypothetical protein
MPTDSRGATGLRGCIEPRQPSRVGVVSEVVQVALRRLNRGVPHQRLQTVYRLTKAPAV